jgi:hypothetical protein
MGAVARISGNCWDQSCEQERQSYNFGHYSFPLLKRDQTTRLGKEDTGDRRTLRLLTLLEQNENGLNPSGGGQRHVNQSRAHTDLGQAGVGD